ncbi:MAG: amidohydrolase family protein [Gemmatimonadales bacterium]|nr:amidohydrolase family protein [Gemmatimonadales bacterium]NIQ99269.1 amidohydrolase family protein [Gemmatimonadales bacterium]
MTASRTAFSIRSICGLIVSSIVALPAAGSAQEADRAYINGTIYTVDEDFSTAAALAVKDGRFIYVGDVAGVQAHIGPNTFVIDLDGKTIIPGLHDAHVHIRYGERELYPRTPDIRTGLGEWASVERMQQVIRHALATGEGMRPGSEPRWIVLRGWMSDVWDPPVFRKELIDAVAPDNPVFISRYTHGSGANSKALELAGITRDTPDPPGGHIKKDEHGEPTGEFVERAPPQLTRLIPGLPPLTNYERSRNLVEGTQLAVASGLTTIHGASGAGYEEIQRRIRLYEVGLLRIRINEMVSESAARRLGEPLNHDDKYFVQSVKTFADGALGSRGALLLEEYSDYPGYLGEAARSEDALARSATELLRMGFTLRVHSIGDGGNHAAINAFERALKATGIDGTDARFALEHAQMFTPSDLPRLVELGIVASVQPLHATEDMHFAEARIGPERLQYAYNWSDLLDRGVALATGTDYSVSPYNPFYTLHAAVTRQDRNNNPPGGWIPEQAMTREEALRAATMGGAYVMHAEDILGSIQVGKLADFVVIPVDYMTIPAEDIWKIEPVMTVIGGEVVYTRPIGST